MAVWVKRAKSGKYTVFVKHNGRRSSETLPTLAEANKVKRETEQILSEDDSAGLTFHEMAELWLIEYVQRLKSPATHQKYSGLLRKHIYPSLKRVPVKDIDRPMIRGILKRVNRTMSKSTVRAVKDVIAGVMNFCLDEGKIKGVNPAFGSTKNLGVDKEKNTDDLEIFTLGEMDAALEVVRKYRPRLYPLFFLLFRSGLRLGEALALDFDDINYKSGYIVVRKSFKNGVIASTKTKKSRQVDMSDDLISVLVKLKKDMTIDAVKRGEPLVELFLSPAGKRLSQNSARNVWKRCLSSAGVEHRKIHSTRHTFASYLLAGGADIYYVSKMLGHSKISMTSDTYGHLVPDRDRSIMNILDGQLRSISGQAETKMTSNL